MVFGRTCAGQYLARWRPAQRHTVELSQAAVLSEFEGGDAQTIVLDNAAATRKINGRIHPGGFCVERVLEELQHDAGQRHDGGRGRDLGDHVVGQGQYASPRRCWHGISGVGGSEGVHDVGRVLSSAGAVPGEPWLVMSGAAVRAVGRAS